VAKHLDVTIAELAASQHGVVTRRQLLAFGAGEAAIRHRLAVRRLHRIHAGIYVVGHRLQAEGRYLAAVMACGNRAVLSHRSAAALWGFRPAPSDPISVTVAGRANRNRSGITVHATRSLDAADVTERDGIPCTSIARTLLDLAGVVTRRVLDRAIEQSLILRLYDGASVDAVLERANGRRGAGVLRRALAHLADDPATVRSELERRFVELVRDAGLPAPAVNTLVADHEVDFCWPAHRLVVETDGRATHDTPYAFERDRRRDLDLEQAGWHVLRVSWRQLAEGPGQVTAILRDRLAA
jgi:very-short-patch-repair endonuclease